MTALSKLDQDSAGRLREMADRALRDPYMHRFAEEVREDIVADAVRRVVECWEEFDPTAPPSEWRKRSLENRGLVHDPLRAFWEDHLRVAQRFVERREEAPERDVMESPNTGGFPEGFVDPPAPQQPAIALEAVEIIERLNAREREVLERLAKEESPREISRAKIMSRRAVQELKARVAAEVEELTSRATLKNGRPEPTEAGDSGSQAPPIDDEIVRMWRRGAGSRKTCCKSRCWQCSYGAGFSPTWDDLRLPLRQDDDLARIELRINWRKAAIAAEHRAKHKSEQIIPAGAFFGFDALRDDGSVLHAGRPLEDCEIPFSGDSVDDDAWERAAMRSSISPGPVAEAI